MANPAIAPTQTLSTSTAVGAPEIYSHGRTLETLDKYGDLRRVKPG